MFDVFNEIPKSKNIQQKIKRLWADEFNSLGKKYKAFFDYLRRIYMVYPKIDAQRLFELREAKATPLEIDRALMKLLIIRGYNGRPYSSDDLVPILRFTSKNSGVDTQTRKYVRLFLRDIFEMNMFEVNQQFYWKTRVKILLRKGFTNIENFLDHPFFRDHYSNENTLRKLFKKIWKIQFDEIKNRYPNETNHFPILFKFLVKRYSNKKAQKNLKGFFD